MLFFDPTFRFVSYWSYSINLYVLFTRLEFVTLYNVHTSKYFLTSHFKFFLCKALQRFFKYNSFINNAEDFLET